MELNVIKNPVCATGVGRGGGSQYIDQKAWRQDVNYEAVNDCWVDMFLQKHKVKLP